ncbi:tumor necrosis factor receptor superfamily member 5 isoform X2 [Chelmon rostratus]|uniref:tumor necrosis factor receptor superfamily member 5 isoform X2 n=1 Tax=Chelmon rostratus TaxID=109905 RepID=UPI001BEBCA2F|nr:tumor necrosis factor receptor superfamily member 5 isoform X2 [Chelmon rostratus]
MAKMNCTNEDKYTSKDGRCCDRCRAGWYMKAECAGTKATECAECGHGLYTATKNHLSNCHVCKDCSSSNNQRKVKDCTAQEDAVCECLTGFYCSNEHCDHCRPVTHCKLGEGVKVRATRTSDTVCAPCEKGTYSNVTDFHSPCLTHTRCDDIGRWLKTSGTKETDAICGNFKSHCHWILPAGLWSGLVLTALVLFGLIWWREKRKSSKAATLPVTLVEMVPAAPDSPLDLPLPSTERNGYCQESCTVNGCDLTLFTPDDNVVSDRTHDSMDSCLPITPLKPPVSFSESSHKNGSAGYCTSNFLRTYSEPQEDEWCGT